MKRCPHAVWDPLGDQTQPKMTAHDIVCVPPEDVPDYAKRVFYIPVSGVSGIGMTPDAALRSYCAEHDHERSVDELVRVNAIMAEPLVSDDN